MSAEIWYLLIGGLFVLAALTSTYTRRLPLTLTMLHLTAGLAVGPVGFGIVVIDVLQHAAFLERISEIAVLISLFTAGLKLRCPFPDARWAVPLRLASASMVLTVGCVAVVGTQLLGLPGGAAVLLGAVLAPTDPVLASDVQLESAADRNELRFGITGEAGLNDGTAFPFVMLGLGLLGLHELGQVGWRWFTIDLIWAVIGGLVIGAVLGTSAGRAVLHLRRERKEALGRDEFLAVGIIAVSYGAALLANTYGFLSVLAAGLALRNMELRHAGEKPVSEIAHMAAAGQVNEVSTNPETAPAYMAEAVLATNERIERLLEVFMVLLVGFLFKPEYLNWSNVLFAGLLIGVIRPIAVYLGLLGTRVGRRDKAMFSWFGIRGVGSIYYLMHSIGYGLPLQIAHQLVGVTLTVIIMSILAHGVSVTPLLRRFPGDQSPEKVEASSG